jgi:hypothetical protein
LITAVEGYPAEHQYYISPAYRPADWNSANLRTGQTVARKRHHQNAAMIPKD